MTIGTYECGHGRRHGIPSDAVRILRMGGVGFIAACNCSDVPLSEIGSNKGTDGGGHSSPTPTVIGDHLVTLTGVSPETWLELEAEADGWFHNPDGGALGNDPSYRERRAKHQKRFRMKRKTDTETDAGIDQQENTEEPTSAD